MMSFWLVILLWDGALIVHDIPSSSFTTLTCILFDAIND